MSAPHRAIAKSFLAKLLFAAWLFTTASPVFVIAWLKQGHEDKFPDVSWFALPWLFVAMALSWFLAHAMARHIIDDNVLFLDSIKRSWLDLRFQLAWIPILGQFFTPDEDKTKRDDGDR